MKKIVLSVAIATLFFSCKKEKYDFDKFSVSNLNGEYAVPLVASELTIQDILTNADKNGNIQVGNDGFCTLIYRGTLFTSRAKDFVIIGNQTLVGQTFDFSNTIPLSTFNAAANGTQFGPFTNPTTSTITPTPPLIDSLYINSGTSLDISINNTMPALISLTITSPSIIDLSTSSTFNKIIILPANSNTVVTYDLGNHLLKLNDGIGRSRLNLTYTIKFQKTNNATGLEQIGISAQLNNISFNKFIGYLGSNYTHPNFAPYKDTVPISLFTSSEPTYTNTIFSLVDPKFEVKFYNELGVSAKVNFTKLDAYTPDAYGNNLNPNTLTGSSYIQNIIINPATNFSSPVTTTLNVDKNNVPQVVPFINSRPKNVIYEVNGNLNPSGPGYLRNFFTDTSKIRVDLDVILPLWGNMTNLVFVDTIKDIDFSNIPAETKKLLLRTYFESTFPVDMGIEIVFTDTLYNPLYVFIPANTVVIPGASVDSNGMTNAPKIHKKDYIISNNNIPSIKNSKRILIRAFANTTNYPTNVKIYNFQKLKVRIGLDVQPAFK